MPNWDTILQELREYDNAHDRIRRKYLERLYNLTGRNTIIYYSGWLQKKGVQGLSVRDSDKNGFMNCIHRLDRDKGLDLVLHTPGGETAATESLVHYLRSMFGANIRAIVPQLAMSAGTMIACACKEIIMGKQSNLGPIDPIYGGLPAHGVVEEWERAYKEVANGGNAKLAVWQPILAKYNPTLIGECEKAIQWAEEMVEEWLKTGMLANDKNADKIINTIIEELGDHALNKSHARHLPAEKCSDMGLKIVNMEDKQDLQDAILSVHHACIHTLSSTNVVKIIENHDGTAFIQSAPVQNQ